MRGQHHGPLLAEMLVDFMIGDLLAVIGRAYFTINAVQKVSFADGQAIFEGQGYYGVYVIWLTHGYGRK